MRAAPDQQQRLLDLQAIDTRLQQLEHQKATLPAVKQVEGMDLELLELHRASTDSQTAAADLRREVAQAESEVDAARTRADKNQARISSGALSAKDAMALADDMGALKAWIETLEETQLDAMERLEAHQTNSALIEAKRQQLAEARTRAAFSRDKALDELTQQIKALVNDRAGTAGTIFPELLKQYDSIRSRLGGVGAARLVGGRCEGCGLTLPPKDLEAAFAAPADEVVRCEECGRILVRPEQ